MLQLDVFSWAAKPLVFNEVAGGVGACMVRYALPASGKEWDLGKSKNNNTPFAFEQEVTKHLPGVSLDADNSLQIGAGV